MNLKFLIPLPGLISGILLANKLNPGLICPAISFGFALFSWVIIFFLSKNPITGLKISRCHSIWIFLLFQGIGSLSFVFNQPYINHDIEGQKCFFKGEIEEVSYLTSGDKFKVKILNVKDSTKKYIFVKNFSLILYTDGYSGSKGDLISFSAIPLRIKDSSNNGFPLSNTGIQYYSNVKSNHIKKEGEVFSLSAWFFSVREDIIVLLENSSLDRETLDFLISILLGEKSFLSKEIQTSLNSAGIAHILALSGMHIAILYGILMLLFFPLALIGCHKSRRVLALFLIWLFVLFTGASPSTVRAAIMATFVLLSYVLERKNSALNALMAATTFILIYNPFDLWNIGLQLSFLCVAGIILFSDKLNPVAQHQHPKLYKICEAILIPLITTFTTWILIARYFGNVPTMFLIINIIILPFLPLFIGLGIIYLLCISLGTDILLLAKLLDSFYQSLVKAIEVLSFSGLSTINVEVPSLAVFLWFVAIFGSVFLLYSHSKKLKKIFLIISPIFIGLSIFSIVNLETEINPSVKFPHSFTKIEAIHSVNNNSLTYNFPRKTISKLNSGNMHILSIDNNIHTDSLYALAKTDPDLHNFLMVGPDAYLSQVAGLISDADFSKIILHSGVGKNKKAELLHLLDEKFWDKVYSLRDNGSLSVDLID